MPPTDLDGVVLEAQLGDMGVRLQDRPLLAHAHALRLKRRQQVVERLSPHAG